MTGNKEYLASTTSEPAARNSAPASPLQRKRKESYSVKDGQSGKPPKRNDNREPPETMFLSDIGGLDDIINDLWKLIGRPLTDPEFCLHTRVQQLYGIVLHGPPGCGKTMLVKAIAQDIGVPLFSVWGSRFMKGMYREPEKKLREIFEEAYEKAPCLIFMDEIDAISPKWKGAEGGIARRIAAQLLACIDDFALRKTGGKPVIIIGATNQLDSLDPALRTTGRFDQEICIKMPDEVGRERILRMLCANRKLQLSQDFDFKRLAKRTRGFVGLDLSAMTSLAISMALKRFSATAKICLPPTNSLEIPVIPPLDGMDVNQVGSPSQSVSVPVVVTPDYGQEDPAQRFLSYCELFKTPLDSIYITVPDFLTALPEIRPICARTGFARAPDVTWADIGARDSLKLEMQKAIVQPIKELTPLLGMGITGPAGALLYGPHGCGKTMLAKAVADEIGANFIEVYSSECLLKFYQEPERCIRHIFSQAQVCTPCIIFFDELDALAPSCNNSHSKSSSQVVNTLLSEFDSLNDRPGIYVMGATTRLELIDPAMLAPGRLSQTFFIDLPDAGGRLEILKLKTKNIPLLNVDLQAVAEDDRCKYFSGAKLGALVTAAGIEAFVEALRQNVKKGKRTSSLSEIVPSTPEHFEKALTSLDLMQFPLREAFGEDD
ncbi:P-loop containing nucleoside triphosphate hydrolase protein [Tuber borchii]|uniref:P-loop containing nucleoside triphosphate hydrolase protein n=1 Tax=Tuber borchii TaxID=42251 RepID=A0A2T6ZM23_TUBBO|nr:P-loop containing nucleoside triphosphate hydrolase protein [Tuber borchii]